MKMKNLTICLTLAVLLASAGTSWGADFNKGLAAAKSGDFATALQEWTPLAEQGYADAQFYLGWMYEKGKGVLQDYKTAVKWYTLPAEQGYADAQFYLGLMYEKGQGVLQDYKTALKWYTLAAKQGDAAAQFTLGRMNRDGQGVPQDFVYAHMWWNIAASNGDENGGKLRDEVAKEMTATQIEKAQELARECVRKKYIGC
jgi:uncharacterized protein